MLCVNLLTSERKYLVSLMGLLQELQHLPATITYLCIGIFLVEQICTEEQHISLKLTFTFTFTSCPNLIIPLFTPTYPHPQQSDPQAAHPHPRSPSPPALPDSPAPPVSRR
jgi:hypothetical protein